MVYVSKHSQIVLGVTIDDKLCLLPHVKDICDKANRKTNALLRIRSYSTQVKAEILCNCFILPAFNYSRLQRSGDRVLNQHVYSYYARNGKMKSATGILTNYFFCFGFTSLKIYRLLPYGIDYFCLTIADLIYCCFFCRRWVGW